MLHVLVIEDNPGDARLIREMLGERPERFRVHEAESIAAALVRLREHDVDIVLLDVNLPDANGTDGLERISDAAPEVPVVLMTGVGEPDGPVSALRAGAQDYLIKGEVDGPLLRKTLEYASERQRLQLADHFLAEAGRVLAASFEYETRLEEAAELAVRSLADLCIVELIGEDGERRRLRVAFSARFGASLPPDSRDRLELGHSPTLTGSMSTRTTRLFDRRTGRCPMECVESEAADELTSCIAVPFATEEGVVGGMLLGSTHLIYGPHEATVLERLADIAALQIRSAELYRHAQEAIRARDRVLGVVAHDLRNPLNTISMIAELLLDGRYSPEQTPKQLHVVLRSVDRMDRLIQDLLDVVRMESDRLVLNPSYQDAGDLARESVELNSALAATKSIALGHAVEGVPGPVVADHDRVIRVLDNLIGNAVKFSPSGTRITVAVAADAAEPAVRFTVTDTGPGIPPDELSELFKPFWQARRGREGGAGLGLAIARGIIEAHGGRIGVESEVGSGTTFWFTLPAGEERRGAADA